MAMGGMLSLRGATTPVLHTERLVLRPPRISDHAEWSRLRRGSEAFLQPWEPAWGPHHLSFNAFKARVRWSRQEIESGRAIPWLIFRRDARSPSGGLELVGGVTLEHIRRGAAQSASVGYWLGQPHVRQGYMSEAIGAVTPYVFDDLDLSRIEAACLPENAASRRLLTKLGFAEGRIARAFLQIDGAWRDHLIFERFRSDRLSAPS